MPGSWSFKGKQIFKDGKKFLRLTSEINNILVNGDLLIVLLKHDKKSGDRNVFCYNTDKSLKWQIPEPVKIHSENYYTGIYFQESGFYAYSCNGFEYCIDVNTGSIIDSKFIK